MINDEVVIFFLYVVCVILKSMGLKHMYVGAKNCKNGKRRARHKVRVAEIVDVPGAELKAGYAESGEVGQHLTRHRWSPHFDGLVAARVKN